MKKFVKLECSVCKRTRDSLIDLKYYATDKCTITLSCEGRLSPVGYTSDGTAILSIPPTGVTNWYARSSIPDSGPAPLLSDPLYDTSTGSKRQIILAVSDIAIGFSPSSTSTVTLNLLAEQQVAKDYRQYTYRKTGSFTVINGVESGQAKKVLRYTITGGNPDLVEIYVDGVKRDLGVGPSQYQLYDGTVGSAVPPNSILFNTAITGTASQIDAVVTKAATLTMLALPFVRMIDDEARVDIGAWEGVNAITHRGTPWSLFYCDFTQLPVKPLDVKLRLDPNTQSTLVDGSVFTPPSTAMALLFSRTKLHTALDRLRAVWAPITALGTNTHYLVIKLLDGVRQLLITEATTVDVYPPLEVRRFRAASILKTRLSGSIDAVELDNATIIGPDA